MVHSVVSFDFAVSQLPVIFDLPAVISMAGAVFGGFTMVVTLAVPARQIRREDRGVPTGQLADREVK